MKKATVVGSFSGKVVACVLVLACVAIGLIGIVLPIIPGLIFLAIAAVVAARHFPRVGMRIRKHRAMDRHLSNVDRFVDLSFAGKIQIAGWLCAKMLLDGLAFVSALLSKSVAAARRRSPPQWRRTPH